MTKNVVSPFQTILLIDTTERERTNVALIINGVPTVIYSQRRAQDTQLLIDQLLMSQELELKNIDVVGVLTGPGSYTGTRIGVTVANILNWCLGLPIIEMANQTFASALKNIHVESQTTSLAKVQY
jgi:tRNA A37 threonylcarbamoyladenosine modification protein TsaB